MSKKIDDHARSSKIKTVDSNTVLKNLTANVVSSARK